MLSLKCRAVPSMSAGPDDSSTRRVPEGGHVLPGVDPESIDLDVERNVLTVRAERKGRPAEDTEMLAAECPLGRFSRQVILGDSLDAENVKATYDAGVLNLRIPITEKAKPRKIEVSQGSKTQQISA